MARRPVGRGGLVGTAARTAVVAGTATAVAGGVSRHQAAKANEAAAAQAEQQAAAQQAVAEQQAAAAAAAPPPPPPPSAGDATIAELERLATLKSQGILSDEEFTAAKAKVLGLG